MKIIKINKDEIQFDNGKSITYHHEQDCCEDVYADFNQLDSVGRYHTFEEPLAFESVDDYGFRFGNPGAMFFIPCYSEQNGYYSHEIEILYDGKTVAQLNAEWINI